MNLSTSFEADAREAFLDDAEQRLVGEQDNVVFQAVQESHTVLETAGAKLGWSVDPVINSLETPVVDRTPTSVTATWGWSHEAAPFFEFGTSPHTIEGNPILSFIWEDAPAGVREMFANTERVDGDPRVYLREVDHPGTPALRFVREGLRWLRSSQGLRN